MAEHRAEQVVAAVQACLNTLVPATVKEVDRGRAEEIPEDLLPALRVEMGDDNVLTEYSAQLVDCELEVAVIVYAMDSATDIETVLTRLRKEVTIKLMADITLGLAFVQEINEAGAEKPEKTGDLARPAARQNLNFRVLYRRSKSDPSA